MNIGVGIAVLALVQLVLPIFLDRSLSPINKPWFVTIMTNRGNDGLGELGASNDRRGGIGDIFTESQSDLGNDRTEAVLAAAGLVSSARAVFASLCIALLGQIATIVLILPLRHAAPWKFVRIGVLAAAMISTTFVGFQLMSRMFNRAIVTTISGEARFRNEASNLRLRRVRLFWFRAKSRDVLTRYVTISILGSAATILTSLGL